MTSAEFTTCAFCPRLCRHTCPVAVATGRESATPSAMMAALLLVEEGHRDVAYGLAAASQCLGCGACEAHCKMHVPVPERLRAARVAQLGPARPDPLAAIDGGERVVAVLATDRDWSVRWSERSGRPASRLQTRDSLGFTAWKEGSPGVLERVAAHLAGREVVTASGAVAAVTRAAGIPTQRLAAGHAGVPFISCHQARAGSPHQLACCGRREGFAQREPAAASAVAAENVRRFAGAEVVCADEECAAFLRAAGALVFDPYDGLDEEVLDASL